MLAVLPTLLLLLLPLLAPLSTAAATPPCGTTPAVIVLDVRQQSEWDAGHVSCAHRLPVQDDPSLVAKVTALAANDLATPIVTYCYSGVRAGRAETVLESAGFTDVRNGGGYVVPAGNAAKLEALCHAGNCANATAINDALSNLPTSGGGGTVGWAGTAGWAPAHPGLVVLACAVAVAARWPEWSTA